MKNRWNSDLFMVERLVELKESVSLALIRLPDLTGPSTAQWLLASELVLILLPLEAATRALCGDEYSTSSMVIPSYKAITDELAGMILKSKPALSVIKYFKQNTF